LVAFVTGCAEGEDGAGGSTRTASACVEGERAYPFGSFWTCSDGCNGCACSPNGELSKTLVECGSPPGPNAGKMGCWDLTDGHDHGQSWACADRCGECTCDDGSVLRSMPACDAGARRVLTPPDGGLQRRFSRGG
jgi:hypothetical protein